MAVIAKPTSHSSTSLSKPTSPYTPSTAPFLLTLHGPLFLSHLLLLFLSLVLNFPIYKAFKIRGIRNFDE